MEGLLKGDLGYSLEYQRPNSELIGERLVLTIVPGAFRFCHYLDRGRSRQAFIPPRIKTRSSTMPLRC